MKTIRDKITQQGKGAYSVHVIKIDNFYYDIIYQIWKWSITRHGKIIICYIMILVIYKKYVRGDLCGHNYGCKQNELVDRSRMIRD